MIDADGPMGSTVKEAGFRSQEGAYEASEAVRAHASMNKTLIEPVPR